MTSGCAQKRSTSSGSNWVPRRSRATATAACGPAGVVESLDVVGQLDDPDRRRELRPTRLARHAFAVPALESLDERNRHRVAEIEAHGEVAGRLAVRLHHGLHAAAGSRHELADDAHPAQPGRAVAEVLGHEDGQRRPVQVAVVGLREQVRLIAEELGEFAGVGATSDPGEQRRVIRGCADFRLDPGGFRKPHRDDGLAKHALHRPAHAEV